MKFVLCIILPMCLYGIANAVYTNKSMEGYFNGFLADCPGSTKPTVITPQSLKFLEIYISGARAPAFKRIKYTYNTMGLMAKDPYMDWSKRTFFYIPGWMDNILTPVGPLLEFLYKIRGYNVWILGCLKFMQAEYPIAARAMIEVGRLTAKMLAHLTAIQPMFDVKKLDLLGLSLGAQTMSFIAKSYYNITGVKVSRATSLDPGGGCFRNKGPEGRVDESDADFVDIINTNMGIAGMSTPVGQLNIYVNGGEFQPGDIYWMACGSVCSHGRAYTLWVTSLIFPDAFIAMKCDSVQEARDNNCYGKKPVVTNLLGINADRNKTGIFYLATKNSFPFYLGKDGLKKKNNYVLKMLTNLNAKDVLIF